jgi:hypothetical protein
VLQTHAGVVEAEEDRPGVAIGGIAPLQRARPPVLCSREVFKCQHERGDRLQYARTLEALEEYGKKSFKFYEDVAPLFAVTMSRTWPHCSQ